MKETIFRENEKITGATYKISSPGSSSKTFKTACIMALIEQGFVCSEDTCRWLLIYNSTTRAEACLLYDHILIRIDREISTVCLDWLKQTSADVAANISKNIHIAGYMVRLKDKINSGIKTAEDRYIDHSNAIGELCSQNTNAIDDHVTQIAELFIRIKSHHDRIYAQNQRLAAIEAHLGLNEPKKIEKPVFGRAFRWFTALLEKIFVPRNEYFGGDNL